MSTSYLAQIDVSASAPSASEAVKALRLASGTSMFRAFVAYRAPGRFGLLVQQEVGLGSPLAPRGGRGLAKSMRKTLRALLGKESAIVVRVVDLDRADWSYA